MNDDPPPRLEPLPLVDTTSRSSLSPPPPLTIRLGPRPPASASNASPRKGRQAHYSDTSDEEAAPPKKLKLTTGKKATSQSGSSQGLSVKQEEGGAIQAKRSYDWLQPSVAGASHQGPPERAGGPSTGVAPISVLGSGQEGRRISGWAPGEDYVSQVAGELDSRPVKKSGKKDKVPGPGKAWRKGVKK
jgi:hypothetical protein